MDKYINLTDYLHERKLSALNNALHECGKDFDLELWSLIENLYDSVVPLDERELIDAEIARIAEQEEADAESICIVHLHEDDDDFYFSTHGNQNFYTVASAYHNYVSEDVGEITLDSLAENFGDVDAIPEKVFRLLCDAMENEDNIRAALKFDFDEMTVTVCDNHDRIWRTYALDDIGEAVASIEKCDGVPMYARPDVLDKYLEGLEIECVHNIPDESPTMKM